MKTLTRTYLISLISLWLTANLISGLKINGGFQTYLVGALGLTFICLFIKPILRLLFFPVNLLTLGLLSWVINLVILYLLTIFVPQITVSAWHFVGFSWAGFIVPGYEFNRLLTFTIVALTLSFIINFFIYLYNK